jgi:hypothetical protein
MHRDHSSVVIGKRPSGSTRFTGSFVAYVYLLNELGFVTACGPVSAVKNLPNLTRIPALSRLCRKAASLIRDKKCSWCGRSNRCTD